VSIFKLYRYLEIKSSFYGNNWENSSNNNDNIFK